MKLYGLIGFPLGHSFSAKFFQQKFRREGIDAVYRNFELPDIGDLMELLSEYPQLQGLNVTIPYKQQVMPYLTTLSPQAREIGAVNVIRICHDTEGNVATLEGFNTDAPAFARTLAPLLPLEPVSALVLGTGGASRAVCAALSWLGVPYTLVSRTSSEGRLSYEQLSAATVAACRLIVNTTPVGMSPNVDACPPIPYVAITPGHICYDLIYNPEETLFMQKARKAGATVANGLAMLHLQALLAYNIWNR